MTDIRFPRTSNRADWSFQVKNTDPTDGTLIDLSPYQITLQVRRQCQYGPVLSAAPGDGKVTFPSLGIMQVRFPASEMRNLCADTYELGAIVSDGTDTTQLIIGSVPVVDGIVR